MPDTLDGRAKSIIDRVIDLDSRARIETLERECAGDIELGRRVESLLSAIEKDDAFLQQPTVGVESIGNDNRAAVRPGSQIGAYTIIELIGEGGFGSVYLAEQSKPVKRQVALKIIKLGMDTRQVIARFEAERQALAMMDHPNIARVLDVGATDIGRPYFVMELVRGEHITAYCDRQRLSVPERLAIFRDICGAVQHAHQKGVIHRDLKPSNLLVTVMDGRAISKVIDFGIVKATTGRLTDESLQTAQHQLIGTPEYMSPEQTDVAGADIDTRSDIYSLGILLYELLTGNAPFDRNRLRSASFAEMQRIIREEEPPRPSQRLATIADSSMDLRNPQPEGAAPLGSSVIEIAQCRRTEPIPLTRSIRGDLDWIVLKCLEKDRSRRYQTASALAEDIGRHLSHEPVLATPPSATYRFRKFVRRNRAAAGATLAIALTLLAAVGVSLNFGIRESRQRADEENARRQLERVAQFQKSQLTSIQPESMGTGFRQLLLSKARTAAEKSGTSPEEVSERIDSLEKLIGGTDFTGIAVDLLVDNYFQPALSAIESEFANQPLVKATLLQAISDSMRNLGALGAAAAPQAEALDIRRRILGDSDRDKLESINRQGELLEALGKLPEAESHYLEAIDLGRRAVGPGDPETLRALGNMGSVLEGRGKLTEAESYYREAFDGSRRVLGEENSSTLKAQKNLGYILELQARYVDAEAVYRDVLERIQRTQGVLHFGTISSIQAVGRVLKNQGKLAEAQPYYNDALDRFRRLLGDDHPETLNSMQHMGILLEQQGKVREADSLFTEVTKKRRRILGDDHPRTITSILDIARISSATGKYARAERVSLEALERSRRVLGDDHPDTVKAIGLVGGMYYDQRKFAEAEPYYREALQKDRAMRGEAHPITINKINNLGVVLQFQGKLAEAEPLLREALEKRRRVLGEDHHDTIGSINNMGLLLKSQSKLDEAEQYFREALEKYRRVQGEDHPNTLIALINLGMLLERLDRKADAEPFLRQALEKRIKVLGEDHPETLLLLAKFGESLNELGRQAETVSLLAPAEPRVRRVSESGNKGLLSRYLVALGRGRAGGRDFEAAASNLTEAYEIVSAARNAASQKIDVLNALATLYDEWHTVSPASGHAERAAAWRTQLNALRATTQPAIESK